MGADVIDVLHPMLGVGMVYSVDFHGQGIVVDSYVRVSPCGQIMTQGSAAGSGEKIKRDQTRHGAPVPVPTRCGIEIFIKISFMG
jgi:hypothetical protein